MEGYKLSDLLQRALRRLKQRIEDQLEEDIPYVTVSLKRIQRELDISTRGDINFLVRELKKDYRVGRDKDWLIIEEKNSYSS